MNKKEALSLLEVSETDDIHTVRKNYRRLMGIVHPDAMGGDDPEYTKSAQQLNEAYEIAKRNLTESRNRHCGQYQNSRKHTEKEKAGRYKETAYRKRESIYRGVENTSAYTARNIYSSYHMDLDEMSTEDQIHAARMYHKVARGRYLWDPDNETFSLLLKSLYHASQELLRKVEEAGEIDDDIMAVHSAPVMMEILHLLARQYICPLDCLRKILCPESSHEDGSEIYRIQASLGCKGRSPYLQSIRGLQSGEVLYPEKMQDHRLYVKNKAGHSLGVLTLDNDSLYWLLIPILEDRKAQVQMKVHKVEYKTRPILVQAEVVLRVKIPAVTEAVEYEKQTWHHQTQAINEKIRTILGEYRNC